MEKLMTSQLTSCFVLGPALDQQLKMDRTKSVKSSNEKIEGRELYSTNNKSTTSSASQKRNIESKSSLYKCTFTVK